VDERDEEEISISSNNALNFLMVMAMLESSSQTKIYEWSQRLNQE